MGKMRRMQQGASASGILFTLVVLGFFLMVLLKLGPSYMGFWTLKSIMDEVAQSPEPILGGRAAIIKRLQGQMYVNDIRDVSPSNFTVQKNGDDSFEVQVSYEKRQHLFANVDAVVAFTHAVTVKGK